LELSRSSWLVTSLSPGSREKRLKYSLEAGALGALLGLFGELQRKAPARRTGVRLKFIKSICIMDL